MVDALLTLASMSPAERVALGRRGRGLVEREFDMRVLGGRMEALLAEAIEERARTST
jgi:hypothetical protein